MSKEKSKSEKKPKEGRRDDIPGLAFLGCGYDIFASRYADSSGVTESLFSFDSAERESIRPYRPNAELDTAQSEYSIPAVLKRHVKPLNKVEHRYESGADTSSLRTKWNTKTKIKGEYGSFKGELDFRFDSKVFRLTSTKYTSFIVQRQLWSLALPMERDSLRKFLDEDARKAIDDPMFAADDLFDRYGTHFLGEVIIGSDVVYSASSYASEFKSETDIQAKLKVKIDALLEAKVEQGGGYHVKGTESKKHLSISVKGRGIGESQLKSLKDLEKNPLSILKQAHLNPTLIEFTGNSLRPIWELVADSARRKKLEEAYDTYAPARFAENGVEANLVPLFLLVDKKGPRYRLSTDSQTEAPWELDNDGEPWLYMFSAEDPPVGTFPLYEMIMDGKGERRYRYEWGLIPPDRRVAWEREGSRDLVTVAKMQGFSLRFPGPIGFVYPSFARNVDPAVRDPDTKEFGPGDFAGTKPVYCYSRNVGKLDTRNHASDPNVYFYSTVRDDKRDRDAWKRVPAPRWFSPVPD